MQIEVGKLLPFYSLKAIDFVREGREEGRVEKKSRGRRRRG